MQLLELLTTAIFMLELLNANNQVGLHVKFVFLMG